MAAGEVVALTGASGFIGGALVRGLAAAGFRVVGLDRAGPPHPPSPAETIDIDLTSDGSVRAACAELRRRHGPRVASVVHLAAYYDLSGEPSPLYDEVTVRGTGRLLREARELEVGQFVFASTMLVHAPVEPGQRITEDSPLDPRWPYPESKVRTEALIRRERGDVPAVLARIAGVYDDRCHNAFLARQIARIHERSPLARVFPGDLGHGQAFLHRDDLVDAVVRIVRRRASLPAELPLLLGEPETLPYGEVQRLVARLMFGEELETREIPKALAKAGAWLEDEVLQEDSFVRPWMIDFADDHYALDISRARGLLGWEPKHSLRGTLPTMLAALHADPPDWYRSNRLEPGLVALDIPGPLPGGAGEGTAYAELPAKPRAGAASDSAGAHAGHGGHGAPMEHGMAMGHGAGGGHDDMMAGERRQTRWAHLANIALGAWLAASPWAAGADGFGEAVLSVTAERGLSPPEVRAAWLGWSDTVSGLLVALFAALSLSRRFPWAPWANTAVGLWLLFAPLVFWAPDAAAYANDTLVGALVIAFAVLVPMMPGMSMAGMMDPSSVPPGWTYSPSTVAQRLPVIAMALIGLLISRHLTAYQLGHIDAAFDPFFGAPVGSAAAAAGLNGTEAVITSDVSKAWPIPDAGLGAIAYVVEGLMAAMGDRRRWRTMPWMVTFFAILVVPLGVVSVYFIIIQPIVIGTWCGPCLLAGAAMLVMIPYTLDELVATGQFLAWSRRAGRPFWRTFLMGDAGPPGGRADDADDLRSPGAAWADMVRGVTLPWTLAAGIGLGVWLMLTRLTLGNTGAVANSDHLVGALAITVVAIAAAEVTRAARFINVAFGAWLVAAPWLLEGVGSTLAAWASVVAGLLLIAFSLPRGPRSAEHYADWDRWVL